MVVDAKAAQLKNVDTGMQSALQRSCNTLDSAREKDTAD